MHMQVNPERGRSLEEQLEAGEYHGLQTLREFERCGNRQSPSDFAPAFGLRRIPALSPEGGAASSEIFVS